ncbi:MAG: lipase maturation factor family protein [Myxococcota bacterium]
MDESGFWLTRLCFQRGLGLIYLVAFLVAARQFAPLCGEHGLLPIRRFTERVSFFQAPSLFHLWSSDHATRAAAWTGVVLSLLVVTGATDSFGLPLSLLAWAVLWVLYLSFVNVGQTFYAFGWESILLEAGFLAIFLGPTEMAAPGLVIWLIRWLLFRVMFGAGLIKLRGDPCWRNLTCLRYHYETQPIPNPLSWYLHRLPNPVHSAGVLFTHFVELVVPFGYFAPAPVCWIAGAFTILFQGVLIISGNLSWLNYVTIILAVGCFDDVALATVLPLAVPDVVPAPAWHQGTVRAVTIMTAAMSYLPIRNMLSSDQAMNASYNPFHLVGTYGAFGGITRRRFEVILEGTHDEDITDDTRWLAYEFKAKPGNPSRRPRVIAPYHLRLDWLMWFAAMSGHRHHPWFVPLVVRLLQGDRATLKLLAHNPFPERPPRYVRAELYLYRFTTRQQRQETGRWWWRVRVGSYLAPVSLASPAASRLLGVHGWRH